MTAECLTLTAECLFQWILKYAKAPGLLPRERRTAIIRRLFIDDHRPFDLSDEECDRLFRETGKLLYDRVTRSTGSDQ